MLKAALGRQAWDGETNVFTYVRANRGHLVQG